ncbi:MAG: helix-turn-helix domain-containing protein [Verrucomicrobia bacterium]|nr:helix-turn-helix domain-containing protein [Verrucomicrobiota bacterium]
MDNPVLPKAQLSLTYLRPKVSRKPDEPKTLGDHIRRRRRALGLRTCEVASLIGTTRVSVWSWEHNRSAPQLCFRPAVLAFLGYDPSQQSDTAIAPRNGLTPTLPAA